LQFNDQLLPNIRKGEEFYMKSKFWVLLTLIIVASMVLASCAPAAPAAQQPAAEQPKAEAPKAEEPKAEAPKAQAPAAGQPVTITIFVGFGTGTSPEQQEVHAKIAEDFNSTHTDIQIEFLTVPWAERITKFSTMLAGDMAPDIVMPIGVGGIAEFYEEWADLTPYIVKDNYDLNRFAGKTVEIHKYPERGMLGLPMCVFPTAVLYNKDIFDAAGVDYPPHNYGEPYADGDAWTYDKMVEIAKKMSLDANGNDANSPAFDGKNMKQWGWAGWDWFNNVEYAAKFGEEPGTIVSLDKRKSLLSTEQYKNAVKFNKDTMWTWHVRATGEQAGAFYDRAGDPMGSGMVGMWEIHTWIKYAWDSWQQSFNFDIAAVPAGPTGKVLTLIDADTFVMPKSGKNKDQAWEVIKWFFERDMLKRLTDNYGCIPADADLAAGWVGEMEAKYPGINHQVFIDGLDYGETTNHESWRPEYTKINDAVAKAMDQINTGQNLDVDAVMAEADKEVQALLDEYWKNR
jgi:multiple sugar transport system substrate-binding protein